MRPRGGAGVALWIRAILSALLFGVALLTVFPAPTTMLWLVEVAVTEWGFVLAIAALALIAVGPRGTGTGALASVLNLTTIVLALSPWIRAESVAQTLPSRIAVFGDTAPHAPGRNGVLSLRVLVTREAAPDVRVTTETYAVHGGHPLALDVYRASSTTGAAPLVLMIHGGSWSGGTRRDIPDLNRYLAARGYVVAAPDYLLAPDDPFPAARDDIADALRYLRTNATKLGVDTSRVVLMGRSAGGELALLVAYTLGDAGIRGAIGFYSPTDMRYAYAHPSNPHVLNSVHVLQQYLAGTPASGGARYAAASPIGFAGTAVPTLLLHGDRDELVSVMQSVRLDSALASVGKPHLLLRLPWATHGCDFAFTGPCGQIGTYAVERFLAAVTR